MLSSAAARARCTRAAPAQHQPTHRVTDAQLRLMIVTSAHQRLLRAQGMWSGPKHEARARHGHGVPRPPLNARAARARLDTARRPAPCHTPLCRKGHVDTQRARNEHAHGSLSPLKRARARRPSRALAHVAPPVMHKLWGMCHTFTCRPARGVALPTRADTTWRGANHVAPHGGGAPRRSLHATRISSSSPIIPHWPSLNTSSSRYTRHRPQVLPQVYTGPLALAARYGERALAGSSPEPRGRRSTWDKSRLRLLPPHTRWHEMARDGTRWHEIA